MLSLGEISLDRVLAVEAIPALGQKQTAIDVADQPGGQGATAALACARLGLRAACAGAVGEDDAGDLALAPLEKAGVDLAAIARIPDLRTRSAVILVERARGERAVVAHRDPGLVLPHDGLLRNHIASARCLLVDSVDPDASLWAAEVARAEGVPVVLDADTPGPAVERLLSLVDFPIVPRGFAEEFSGTTSVPEALGGLLARGARLAVMTCGEAGSIAGWGGRTLETPGFRVPVRDTTGAGDAFHAGFAWALLRGLSAGAALRLANAVAALACCGAGAQGGLPGREAVDELLSAQPG